MTDQADVQQATILDHVAHYGGVPAVEKYGRDNVLAAMIPED